MADLPPKYHDVFDWLVTALDSIGGAQGKIVLNVNGGAVDADLVTSASEVDGQGRSVKVERRTTTHLRINGVKRAAMMGG